MTKEEIKNKLTELEIEFDDRANKDELQKLLDEKETNEDDLQEETQTEPTVEEELEQLKQKQYIVIHDFKDLKDNDTIYIKDDIYPRRANTVEDEERIQELMSSNNKIGKPLIKEQE